MNKSSFTALKAADIMQRKVVVVGPTDSLHDAMTLMTEQHVTGLPVLNSKDRCMGVISASDILNFVGEHSESGSDAYMGRFYNPDQHSWERIGSAAFAVDDYGETPVSELMARDLVAVGPETPIRDTAQLMEEKAVHRILVLDDQQKLHGIISSFDFVHMVSAMEDS